MLDPFLSFWPITVIFLGLLIFAWGEGDKVATSLGKLRSASKGEPPLGPHDLFERLYDLRAWCETAGRTEAVKALDESVLPAIVRGNAVVDGGPKA